MSQELLDALEQQINLKCDGCSNPATIGLSLICGCVLLACAPCRHQTLERLKRKLRTKEFGCPHCDHWFPVGAYWREIVTKEEAL